MSGTGDENDGRMRGRLLAKCRPQCLPNAITRLDPQADWIGADVNPTPQFGSTLVNAAETLSKT
jgi:hypothetical protein